MKKRSLLRRSGVSFRSAAEESRIEEGIDACTPGPSRPTKSTTGPSKPTKYKRKADKDQMEQARKTKKNRIVEYSEDEVMERAQKAKKHRIVEYSEDESDEDDESDWAVTGALTKRRKVQRRAEERTNRR